MMYLEMNVNRLQKMLDQSKEENLLHVYVHESSDQSLDLALQKIDHFIHGYAAEVVVIRYMPVQ